MSYMSYSVPPALRDAYLRGLAERLGEPESFGAPHWYRGVWGWILNTGDRLLIFGDEASFAEGDGMMNMSRISMPERRYAIERIATISDPCDAMLFLVEAFRDQIPTPFPPQERSNVDYEYHVILKACGENVILTIKTLRELTPGLGLWEAKKIVGTVDAKVKEFVGKDEAEAVAEKLRAVGAVVEVVRC